MENSIIHFQNYQVLPLLQRGNSSHGMAWHGLANKSRIFNVEKYNVISNPNSVNKKKVEKTSMHLFIVPLSYLSTNKVYGSLPSLFKNHVISNKKPGQVHHNLLLALPIT